MSQPPTMDNTMGAMYIGVLIAAMLYGAACIQAWYYYLHQSDRWPLRTLVGAVMLVDTLHQALIAHTVYHYLITNFANPLELNNTVWSLLAEVLVNGFTAVFVQSFLTYRVWQLSNGNIWITVPAVLLVVAEFVCVFVFTVIGLTRVHTYAELAAILKGLSITVNVLAAVGDSYIAGLLTLLLHTSRTGFRRSDTIINKLIIFAVNTGALTSLCAVASMLSILLAPNTFIYISFFFCMGRLYANSLLATLNVRVILRKEAGSNVHTSGDTGSIPLGNYNSSMFQPPSAISVKIDTRREFVTDREREQKHDDNLTPQKSLDKSR